MIKGRKKAQNNLQKQKARESQNKKVRFSTVIDEYLVYNLDYTIELILSSNNISLLVASFVYKLCKCQ